jgi:glutamate racemase
MSPTSTSETSALNSNNIQKPTTNATDPIGVFDSGVGGLTVLKTLALQFPKENFIYLGDTARLPYGTKSAQTIFNYSQQIVEYLIGKKVKAIVIACNSASSHFKTKELSGVPIYNVIEPGAQMALKNSENKVIGILGTRATVSSNSYPDAIHSLDSSAKIFQVACPLLVPLAEEGWIQDPVTNLIAYRYIQALSQHRVDTIVLGCTHYPILKEAIQKAAGQSVTLVESGAALAEILKAEIAKGNWKANPQESSSRFIEVLTTDKSDHFVFLAQEILHPIRISFFDGVDL